MLDGLSHAGAQSYDALPSQTGQRKQNRIIIRAMIQGLQSWDEAISPEKALDERGSQLSKDQQWSCWRPHRFHRSFVRIPHHTPPLIWKTNHHLFQQEPSLVRWPDDGTKYTQYTRSWFLSQREPKPPHKSDLLMLLGSWCKYIWFTNPVHVTL